MLLLELGKPRVSKLGFVSMRCGYQRRRNVSFTMPSTTLQAEEECVVAKRDHVSLQGWIVSGTSVAPIPTLDSCHGSDRLGSTGTTALVERKYVIENCSFKI